MRESGAPIQITTVMEGESLLNDGFSIVLFELFVELASGHSLEAGDVATSFVQLAFGGIAFGLVWGGVVIALLGRIQHDSVIELALVCSAAYLLYYVADFEAEVSGVLAVVAYGLCFPWFGSSRFSPGTVPQVASFLEMMAYFSETIIFVLLGVIISARVSVDDYTAADYGQVVLLWFLSIFIRMIMFIVLSPILARTGHGFDRRRGAAFTMGGLRGAVSVALAMSVSVHPGMDPDVQGKILLCKDSPRAAHPDECVLSAIFYFYCFIGPYARANVRILRP